jgi:hypothetical protein
MRPALAAALTVALIAAFPAGASQQTRVKSYCSETGDLCYGVFKTGSTYRFRLTLAAKYFRRYRVCVVPLGQSRTCKSFPVKKTGAQWGGTVVWQRNFPVRGPRGYRVSWWQSGHRLGPPLTFYLPAPA